MIEIFSCSWGDKCHSCVLYINVYQWFIFENLNFLEVFFGGGFCGCSLHQYISMICLWKSRFSLKFFLLFFCVVWTPSMDNDMETMGKSRGLWGRPSEPSFCAQMLVNLDTWTPCPCVDRWQGIFFLISCFSTTSRFIKTLFYCSFQHIQCSYLSLSQSKRLCWIFKWWGYKKKGDTLVERKMCWWEMFTRTTT